MVCQGSIRSAWLPSGSSMADGGIIKGPDASIDVMFVKLFLMLLVPHSQQWLASWRWRLCRRVAFALLPE